MSPILFIEVLFYPIDTLRIETGRSTKRAIFQLRWFKYQYVIHQMKDIIFLYLLTYLNLMINVKLENKIWKSNIFTFIF